MSALPNRSTMSVEEYFELDRNSQEVRYEYIDGHIYMMAGGSANHSRISANIIGLLYNQLRGGSCDIHTTDMKVQLSERRYVYPDVSVSCDDRDRGNDDRLHYPCLVIEVLSPSTE